MGGVGAKPLLNEQRTKRQSYRLFSATTSGVELSCLCSFQHLPLHQGGEEHPAVVRVQRATKMYMELLD